MSPKIETPVKGFNGVVAGVSFTNGEGSTEDSNALAYFERHGYKIDAGKEPTEKEKLQAEAKELGLSVSGKVEELKARIAEHKAPNSTAVDAGKEPTGEGTTGSGDGSAA